MTKVDGKHNGKTMSVLSSWLSSCDTAPPPPHHHHHHYRQSSCPTKSKRWKVLALTRVARFLASKGQLRHARDVSFLVVLFFFWLFASGGGMRIRCQKLFFEHRTWEGRLTGAIVARGLFALSGVHYTKGICLHCSCRFYGVHVRWVIPDIGKENEPKNYLS